MANKIGPILIGLAYLALVVFIILFCAAQTSTFDEYSKYWGLSGTLIGVATGAIPTFFFKAQADKADDRAGVAKVEAASAYAEAMKASKRAEIYAAAAPADIADRRREEIANLL